MSFAAFIPLSLMAAAPGPQTGPLENTVAQQPAVSTSEPEVPVQAGAPNGHIPHTKGDPLEGFNRAMFSVNHTLDKAIFRPAAMGYKQVVPKPARSGVRNAFSNLTEPVVFLNDVLQLRFGNAFRTFTRFAINTVFGVGGLFDVAKGEGLPHRANGLGNTLARYGVKSGPYLFLPFLGPSSLRDLAGGTVDGLVVPTAVGHPFDRTEYQIGRAAVTGLDMRAEVDSELSTLYDTALDPYATLRSVYTQSRAADIAAITGKAASGEDDQLEDPLQDPAIPMESPSESQPDSAPQP